MMLQTFLDYKVVVLKKVNSANMSLCNIKEGLLNLIENKTW